MTEVSNANFGLFIAYVLPGFVSLLAVGYLVPGVWTWLLASPGAGAGGPTVASFLYLSLSSVGAGLTASTVRWVVMDWLHHHTGVPRPNWDDARLQEKLGAFEALVENHYRYYQFYGNSCVALAFLFAARRVGGGVALIGFDGFDGVIVGIFVIFWAGSRDTLRRYYTRATVLLGDRKEANHDKRACESGCGGGRQKGRRKKGRGREYQGR
ncbi:MAG: hypothetical protein HY287_03535 [Planctomycetes bacterium]|nr:hypothetical protein [Planctomycetota bacterium]MBI3833383.1 hypothetical protein [Planctomycetota bacterium]